MARREFYANWKVTHGEGKDIVTINPGETKSLDDGDPAVKRLVERGAITPLPAKSAASVSVERKADK